MPKNPRIANFPDQLRSALMGNNTAVKRGQALVYASATDMGTVVLATADNQANHAGAAYMDIPANSLGLEASYVAGGDVDILCSGAVPADAAIVTAANGSYKAAAATNKNVCGKANVTGADGDMISGHINQTRGMAVS